MKKPSKKSAKDKRKAKKRAAKKKLLGLGTMSFENIVNMTRCLSAAMDRGIALHEQYKTMASMIALGDQALPALNEAWRLLKQGWRPKTNDDSNGCVLNKIDPKTKHVYQTLVLKRNTDVARAWRYITQTAIDRERRQRFYGVDRTDTGRMSSRNPNIQNAPRQNAPRGYVVSTPGKMPPGWSPSPKAASIWLGKGQK